MVSKFRTLVARRLERQVVKLIQTKKPIVIGVTGSVGKTSTKLAIAQVLGAKYKVLAHEGNYNSEIGLPLSIFELEVPKRITNPLAWAKIFRQVKKRARHFDYQVMVLEMGADQPGDIQKFMGYIKPDIGIVTEIRAAHLEEFKTVEAILKEKLALAYGSKLALINADSPKLVESLASIGKKVPVQTYGTHRGDHRLRVIKRSVDGILVQVEIAGQRYPFNAQVVAEHSLYALAAAAAVGEIYKLKPKQIVDNLAQIRPTKGRMNPLPGLNGSLILDDSYNSSPDAALAALATLKQYPGRKIAILGNMNELGSYAETGHRLVGASCTGIDLLVTIGQSAKDWLASEAKAGEIHSFDSPYEAGQYVADLLQKGDTVLVKGSQNGVFAEEATATLLADPADKNHLVRQSSQWQKRKIKQFKVK